MDRPTRRSVIKGMAVGGALAASGTAAAADAGLLPFAGASGAAPWWMLAPLVPGSRLSGGWFVRDLSRVRKGASVLSLEHATHGFVEVHLCAHDGRPRGTRHFDSGRRGDDSRK